MKRKHLILTRKIIFIALFFTFFQIHLLPFHARVSEFNPTSSLNETQENSGPTTPQSVLNEGLVAHYQFNGNADDESGNGNHATVDGATLSEGMCGLPNSAYNFDGINDKIITPVNSGITNSMTLCAWYKVRSHDVDASLISSRSTDDGGYQFSGLDVSNNPSGSVAFSKSYGAAAFIYEEEFRDTNWHFVAGTYDGETIKVYGDGQLLAEQPATGPVDLAANFIIGFDNSVHQNRYFDGLIDEVRIYNYALPQTEIVDLYSEFECVEPQLIAYYPFNGNADDESGNGNHATVDGATLSEGMCGLPNSAYNFDGINDKIITPVNSGITNSMTLCAWYKVRSHDVDASLISSRSTDDGGYQYSGLDVSNDPSGSVAFLKSYGASAYIYEEEFRDTNWHFVAGTYDGETIKVYGDGQLLAEQPATGPVDLAANFIIGFDNSVHQNRYFDGLIDEVRIYNYALNHMEIINLLDEAACPYGAITGTVSENNYPLENITVKLLDINGFPVEGVEDQLTSEQGEFEFDNLLAGEYQVMIVEPLGYLPEQNPIHVNVNFGETSYVNFKLTLVPIYYDARGKGYWKHQFDVYVRNKGNAQVTLADLISYIESVQQHYTPYFDLVADVISIEDWQALLTTKKKPANEDKAKAQLGTLLLNLTSFKVAQYTIITDDDRTIGDVLTYASTLLSDADLLNDQLARDLLASANSNEIIAAGVVPEGNILYKGMKNTVDWAFSKDLKFDLKQNYPNPFNPETSIRYSLSENSHVELIIYDILGNEVITLVSGYKELGYHEVAFNASELSSGLYIYKLTAGKFVESRKMLLLK